jgi:hypothetical protein
MNGWAILTASLNGARKTFAFTVTTGGSLAGSMSIPQQVTQLSTEGTTDWAHWGLTSATDFNRKATGGSQISNFTVIGSRAVLRHTTNPTGYSWNDGSPNPIISNTITGVSLEGQNNGFRIVVPAGNTPQTLRVYVSGWNLQGRMVAHLSDGSAADYVDTSMVTAQTWRAGVYTLSYRAASAGQTLSVTFTQDTGAGIITLEAATLHEN